MPGNFDDLPDAQLSTTTTGGNFDDVPDFKPNVDVSKIDPPRTSAWEAFGRGFANPASFGIGKWANGLIDATNNLGSSDTPSGFGFTENGATSQGRYQSGPKTGSFWGDVRASVEEQKKDNDTSLNEHPVAYIGGAVAPLAVGGIVKGAGSLTGIDSLGGIGEGIVAPTTWKGIAGTATASGAVQGATDSTTGKQLLTNVPTSAVTSGLLSLVPSSVLAGLDKIGVKGALSRLSSVVDDAMAKNPLTSQPAIEKLRTLVSGAPEHTDMKPEDVQDLVDGMSKKDLIDHARKWSDILRDPEKHATFDTEEIPGYENDITSAKQSRINATGHVVKQLAPGFGTVAGDIALATPGAAAIGFGAHTGGVPGAIIGSAGALAEIPTLGKLGKDAGNYLGMRYAGSQTSQNVLGSATAFGSGEAGSYLSDRRMGLNGILGNYLDDNWLSNGSK